jgi:3-isopropylmalate/(R)-2-methylmalate dehydratase small subunit
VNRRPFTTLSGPAAVLLRANVDTDIIIRVERMTSSDPAALAPFAFEALRYRPDGTEDLSFPFNDPRYRGAQILIAGPNFGCGSSREPAVWAIMGLGVRCVIASGFGDIFSTNCLTNGVLPIVLDDASIEQLAAMAADGLQVTVDLKAQQVRAQGASWPFQIGAAQKLSLLEGLDDLDLALRFAEDTARWEHDDRLDRPWAWHTMQIGES